MLATTREGGFRLTAEAGSVVLSKRFSRSFTLGLPYCAVPLRAVGVVEFPRATLSFTGSETDRSDDLRFVRAAATVGWRGWAVLVGISSMGRAPFDCDGPLYSR